MSGWMDRWKDRWMDGWMEHGWMGTWVNGWMNERITLSLHSEGLSHWYLKLGYLLISFMIFAISVH